MKEDMSDCCPNMMEKTMVRFSTNVAFREADDVLIGTLLTRSVHLV